MFFGRRRFWPAIAGAALLALVVRLGYLAELQGSPLLSGLMGDSRQYDAWAQQIAGGDWIGTQVFYQAPLYPYWLAVIFALAGHSLGLVRVIQAVLGAASCVLLGLAGRRFFSDRAGVIAALLLAVYPPAVFFDGLIQKSSLDIFLMTLMLALIGEFTVRRHWTWLAALGLVAAVFTLNRENARVLLPVIGVWLWMGYRDVPARRRAAWIGVFAAAALAVLLPVGYRNSRVGGEFLLSTSQLGPNFFIGNNAKASGTYEPLVPERGDAIFEREDATRIASAAVGRALSPGEVSDYWLKQSFAYMRSQPLQWLGLLGKKVLLTLNAAELPDTESIEAYAADSRILRALLWLNFGVLLPLAVFGVWVVRAGWRRQLILHGMFASLALTVAVFYVVARYRHPLVPFVVLFAAAGLSGLIDVRRRGIEPAVRPAARGRTRKSATPQQPVASPSWKRQWLPGLAGAGIVAIVANLPVIAVRDQTYLNLGSLLAQDGKAAEAIAVLSKAVSLDPDHAEARFRLGLAYRDAGNPQTAIDELSAAVRLRPDHGDAHAALGIELAQMNRLAEALPHLERAVTLAPDDPSGHANLGMALASAGRLPEGVASLEKARAIATAAGHSDTARDINETIQQLRTAMQGRSR
jgi:tetratricopeptide (TPR) repeat protein